jgi:alpha-ribazole phosphatase/probable phosphoglycerate mutase
MTVTITYFVHGTTTDNEKDIATGWNQGELSEKGIRQAKELASLVSNKQFDVVFCSDLKRAADSAKISFGPKHRVIPDKRLREANYGDYNGKQSSNFKARLAEYIDKPFPNGESYRDVETRIKDFLGFLKKNFDGKHVAIVAHQAPQLALEVVLNNKTWSQTIKEDWRHKKAWQPGWEYMLR